MTRRRWTLLRPAPPTSCSFLRQAAQPLSANCIWSFSAAKKCTWSTDRDGTDPSRQQSEHDRESRPGADPSLGNTTGRLQVLDLEPVSPCLGSRACSDHSSVQKEHPRRGMPSLCEAEQRAQEGRDICKGNEVLSALERRD